MKPNVSWVPWVLVALAMVGCGPDKKQSKALDRSILGEELEFGRKAAKFELWNEAIFRWEKVLEQDPSNANAVNNLAVAYEQVGDFDAAEKLYRQALDLNEDSPEIRRNYKRFLSFYKKHKRQLAREKRAREARREAESEQDPDEGGYP